jgi:hypothetical protein
LTDSSPDLVDLVVADLFPHRRKHALRQAEILRAEFDQTALALAGVIARDGDTQSLDVSLEFLALIAGLVRSGRSGDRPHHSAGLPGRRPCWRRVRYSPHVGEQADERAPPGGAHACPT